MAKLLYIQASPRTARSHSMAVADAFVQAYSECNPDDEIAKLDLFKHALIPFDGLALQAKYAILHGREPSTCKRDTWRRFCVSSASRTCVQ